MTEEERKIRDEEFRRLRLEEYLEYKKDEIRFKTKKEFKEFASNNFCYYDSGFGGYIQALIKTDEEFIDFMLKCCNINHGDGNFQHFINEYAHDNENNHLFFVNEPEDDSEKDDWYADEVYAGTMPWVQITAYKVDYNQFYDDPFEVHRNEEFMTYPEGTFRVNPKTSAKFPAIVRFVSMDTFDRMGSIKGESLEIISLADVEDGQMMFV